MRAYFERIAGEISTARDAAPCSAREGLTS
jgi:hypothetical protein